MSSKAIKDYVQNKLSKDCILLKPSTCNKYRNQYERYIIPFFGDMKPEDITNEKIEDFKFVLISEHALSIRTVCSILSSLQSLLNYISTTETSYVPIHIHYPTIPRKHVSTLSDSELKSFLSFLLTNLNPATFGIILTLYTGLRLGEIAALKWEDINLVDRYIKIDKTLNRICIDDNSTYAKTEIRISSPKTDNSKRIIPISDDIYELCLSMKQNDGCYILTGTEKYMDPRTLQYRLKKYLELCDIQNVHFHSLRHTFATKSIESGIEIKALSEMLGHSSVVTTFQVYVHSTLDFKRENINKLHLIERK